jgi:hypothetical protein
VQAQQQQHLRKIEQQYWQVWYKSPAAPNLFNFSVAHAFFPRWLKQRQPVRFLGIRNKVGGAPTFCNNFARTFSFKHRGLRRYYEFFV